MVTTVKLHLNTKKSLDTFREYKNESYDEVVSKLIYIVKNFSKKPQLSEEAIKAINQARNRIKKGKFISEKEAMKRLSF